STPLAWVNVATIWLSTFLPFTVLPVTTMAASATVVVATLLLLLMFGSEMLLTTEAELVRLPSSVDWAVTVAVTVAPAATRPKEKVTTPLDWLKVPWLFVAETNFRLAPRVSVRTTPVASVGPLLVTDRL